MKKIYPLFLGLFLLTSCGGEESTELTPDIPAETAQDEFFANLFSLCGETFIGESTFPDEPDHVLVDTELKATISTCTEEIIEIDLVRGGDTWHTTWILEKRDEGLHLYHDHIGDNEYEEGEEPDTGYGGYANDEGSATTQYFPADDQTADMLPEAETNVWMLELDMERQILIYDLQRNSEPRFRAELEMIESE